MHQNPTSCANMGHELRTPLKCDYRQFRIDRRRRAGDISDSYRDCARDVYEAGTHLLELVNNVLDVSKLSNGSMALQLAEDDIVSVTQEATKLVSDDIKKRHHKLILNLPQKPLMMPCDRLKLKQILINILSNAAKFTPDKGEISVTLTVLDDEICFAIQDNGVGMSPNDIPRALAQFSQLHPSGVKESAGTGLGLPLAKLLVELHGGRLSVSSRMITFPLGDPPFSWQDLC